MFTYEGPLFNLGFSMFNLGFSTPLSSQHLLPSLLWMLSHEIYVLQLYDGVNENSFGKQQKGGGGGGGGE